MREATGTGQDHDGGIAALLDRVGARVRKARECRGISRRALSERSGVSPRYLAQLEAGEGNISIGLLNRIAQALDQRIEWLVGADDPWSSDTGRVADMFRAADRGVQNRVLHLLSPDASIPTQANRICLIGLRGAGKSTLGRRAAGKLDIPFVELNDEIERLGGMPVPEIMELYGQDGFRGLEVDALDRVAAEHDRVILAAAGGVVAEPATLDKLLTLFHTIWIKAAPQEHMDRVRAQGDERPMAGNPEAMAQLKSLLTDRAVLYARAQAALDTSGKAVDTSLRHLLDLIRGRGFLG